MNTKEEIKENENLENQEKVIKKASPKKKVNPFPKEPAKKIKSTPVDDNDDEDEEDDEEEDSDEGASEGFNKKVLLKLMVACPRVQKYYNDLRNELNQYKSLKFKSNNTGDTYSFKNKVIFKVTVFPKALKVYYALDPKKYVVTKYHHKNVKDIKKYETIPLLLRVSSDRSYKYALELLGDLIKKVKAAKKNVKAYDYLSEFKTNSRELLIAHGGEEFLRASCSKDESILITDSLAKKCVLLENREPVKEEKKIGIISIGEISAAFKSTYTVDLALLKEVGLIEKDVNYLKITSTNNCYKAVTVKADEFDNEAIRMIIISGGNVIKMVN